MSGVGIRRLMAEVPRIFHFIFGLRAQNEPFHLAYYLCLESCRRVNRPRAIHFHYRHLPYGPWWDRIAPHLTLQRLADTPAGFAPGRYQQTQEGRFIASHGLSYAHEADFLRLDILIEHGGVYADIDSLFVGAYPDDLYRHECVLGEEPPFTGANGILHPSLCNAVIVAQPQSRFLRRWRESSSEVFDGTWSRHSCQEAGRLWAEMPEALYVAPQRLLYRFGLERPSFRALFEEYQPDLRGICSIHLWAHLWWHKTRRDFSDFHAGLLTERYVRQAESTYARLARPFLLPDTEIPPLEVSVASAAHSRRSQVAPKNIIVEHGQGGAQVVLFYNFPWDHPLDFPTSGLPDGYVLTTDKRYLAQAVAVIFHVPTLHSVEDLKKKQGQTWVAWSMECDAHYSGFFSKPEIMRLFDMTMSYHLDADVVTTYVQPKFGEQMRAPAQEKLPDNLVNSFISSSFDASGRLGYAKALMQHLDVHCYGKFLNNRVIEHDAGRKSKLAILARYPFTLAFENAIARDYVTEKFFDPLLCGSVPVYLGAPNIEDFAPGDHCFINAAKFPDPGTLADYVLTIARDQEQYQRYLEWKAKPLRPAFIKLLEQQEEHALIRLCKTIRDARSTTKPAS